MRQHSEKERYLRAMGIPIPAEPLTFQAIRMGVGEGGPNRHSGGMGRCALLCKQNEHPKHSHSCFENLTPGTQSINAAGVLGARANTR